MQISRQIVFDDFAHSAVVEACVQREVDMLEAFCDHIGSVQVVVARPQHRYRFCGTHEVRLQLTTQGATDHLVNRAAPIIAVDDDVYSAIDDAFQIARRQNSKHVSEIEPLSFELG